MLRTVAEFFAAGVPVRLWCGQCGDTHAFGADALELTFGPDFDLHATRGSWLASYTAPDAALGD